MMDRRAMISEIDAEIARLTEARRLLASQGEVARGKAFQVVKTVKATVKRQLSPDARKRIADAQKRRWAKVHRESKAAA